MGNGRHIGRRGPPPRDPSQLARRMIGVRVTDAEFGRLKRAAGRTPLAAWIRGAALAAIESQRFVLNLRELHQSVRSEVEQIRREITDFRLFYEKARTELERKLGKQLRK